MFFEIFLTYVKTTYMETFLYIFKVIDLEICNTIRKSNISYYVINC